MLSLVCIVGCVRFYFYLMYSYFFTEKPKVTDEFQVETLKKLKDSVKAIQNFNPISYCLEELYQAVENMCSYKLAPQLYDSLKGFFVPNRILILFNTIERN